MTKLPLRCTLAAVLSMGCGGGDWTGDVRDSAGVSVVTSSASQWAETPQWSVDSMPTLTIGNASDSGAVLLIGVSGVRLLRDGRIAVVSNDEKAVLYFDERGRPTGRVGRPGNAAGEFRQVMLVAAHADSLLLWDSELDRATMVDPGGRVDRTFSFTSSDTVARYGFSPVGRFDDGTILVAGRIGATIGEQSGVRRDPVPLRRASADGTVGDSIGTVPGIEQLVVSTGRYVSAMERPFGRRSLIGSAGDRALVATGEGDQVLVFDDDGGLDAIWRLTRTPRTIDPADLAAQTARMRAQAQQLPADFAAAMLAAVDSAGAPAALPSFDQLLIDDAGATWLRDDVGPIRRDTVAASWTILDRRGRWMGSIVTPRRFVVHQVTKDRLAGVWTDEDGVEQVRVYRLRR